VNYHLARREHTGGNVDLREEQIFNMTSYPITHDAPAVFNVAPGYIQRGKIILPAAISHPAIMVPWRAKPTRLKRAVEVVDKVICPAL